MEVKELGHIVLCVRDIDRSTTSDPALVAAPIKPLRL